jgi:hypothetical protein
LLNKKHKLRHKEPRKMSLTVFAPTTPKGETLANHFGDDALNSHYGPKPKLVV